MSVSETAGNVATLWENATPQEKQPYADLAEEQRRAYDRELEQYQQTPAYAEEQALRKQSKRDLT